MLAVGLIPCTLQLVFLFFIQESPFWLISKGQYEKASFVFARLRSDGLWKDSLKHPIRADTKAVSFFGLMKNKKVLFVIMIGMAINMFQQVTGINAVLFYSPKILSSSGFSSLRQEILASIGIGLINLICTFIAALFIDKAGRKKLLIISLAGMFFFLQLMVLSMYSLSSQGAIVSLVCMLGYVGSFGIGLGPACFILISELYPLAIRGRAMSLAVFANWFFNYLLSLSFPSLVDVIGVQGVFELFVVLIIAALVFVKRLIPETRGKSLAQIEADLML
jgi:MFS family permease